MAAEVFSDTSGCFALMDERDPCHAKAVVWMQASRGRVRPVMTEWIIGETCTLLVARKRPHLVARFLDYLVVPSTRNVFENRCSGTAYASRAAPACSGPK